MNRHECIECNRPAEYQCIITNRYSVGHRIHTVCELHMSDLRRTYKYEIEIRELDDVNDDTDTNEFE